MISKNVKVEVALREEDRPIAFLVQMASQFESKILFLSLIHISEPTRP